MAENPDPKRDLPTPPEGEEASIPPAVDEVPGTSAADPAASPEPEISPPIAAVHDEGPDMERAADSEDIDSDWLDVPNSQPLPYENADDMSEPMLESGPEPEPAVPATPPAVEPEPEPIIEAPVVPPAEAASTPTPAPSASAPAHETSAEPAATQPPPAAEPDKPRRGFLFGLFGPRRVEAPPSAPHYEPSQPPTVTDRARKVSYAVLHPAGALLVRLGVHPDQVTIAGTLLVFVAALLIGLAQLQLGALLLLFALPFDALDGAVARAMGRVDKFGALLDSASDRYADAAIFAGLGYHFAVQNRLELLLLAFAGLMGTYAVSYVRARAEGLGVDVKIGLFTRLERLAMILIMLFVPDLLPIGLIILAIGTNFTSVQRLLYVYRALKQREG